VTAKTERRAVQAARDTAAPATSNGTDDAATAAIRAKAAAKLAEIEKKNRDEVRAVRCMCVRA
jgi:hypothetical protein